MSLINQMLRDLETRRADGSEKLNLPNEVRPLPEVSGGLRWIKPLLAICGVCAVIAALGWMVMEFATAPPPQTPASIEHPLVHHEPVLKLDPDLTVAHVAPPAASRSAMAAPIHTESAAIPKSERTPPKVEEAKAQIEKRPAFTDPGSSVQQHAREQLAAGQRNEAEATLRQALSNEPGQIALRQMLFALMMEQHRSDEALMLLKEGLAIHPEQTQWASNAARLQVDKNDLSGAWETLRRSLPAAASQGEYRAFCGTVLSRLKRYGEAVEQYQAALRTNPDEGRWWVGMALALEADGKLPESHEAFARAQATGKLPPELAAYVDSKLKQ